MSACGDVVFGAADGYFASRQTPSHERTYAPTRAGFRAPLVTFVVRSLSSCAARRRSAGWSIAAQPIASAYKDAASRIIARATRDSAAWNRLALLTERFGNRFSGTDRLERALDWMLAEMQKDGLDNVRGAAFSPVSFRKVGL